MHKFTLTLITTTLLSMTSVAGYSENISGNKMTAKTNFSQYDENKNGMISYTELENNFLGTISNDSFQSYDFNSDGFLSQNEFQKFININRATIVENHKIAMEAKRQNALAKQKVAAINAQRLKEHEIALKNTPKYEDIENAPKKRMVLDFVVFDRNNDRFIDIEEFKYRTNAVDPEAIYASYDENGDKKLNGSEFKRYVNSDPVIPKLISSKK